MGKKAWKTLPIQGRFDTASDSTKRSIPGTIRTMNILPERTLASNNIAEHTALAERNRKLAEQRHRLSMRAAWRRRALTLLPFLLQPRLEPAISGRVVLIRPDHLGDALLTMPAIRALSKAAPDLRLFALSGPWTAPIFSAYDQIEQVLTLPFPGFVRGTKRESPWQPYRLLWHSAAQLRRLRAETAIILRPDHWWGALLAYLAGIPQRIGYDLPDVRPFLTLACALPFRRDHAVRQSLRLVESWTGVVADSDAALTFPHTPADSAEVEALLAQNNLTVGQPFVAIHPGAGTAIKRWPPQAWAKVAEALAERWRAAIVFTGSESERFEIEAIRAQITHTAQPRTLHFSLAGQTELRTLAALYAGAKVVIGPDSGPLHLAVAAGAPTVHLFGPAAPSEFGPWGDPQRQITLTTPIGCRPCRVLDWPESDALNHPCVRDISPQRVIAAAIHAAER